MASRHRAGTCRSRRGPERCWSCQCAGALQLGHNYDQRQALEAAATLALTGCHAGLGADAILDRLLHALAEHNRGYHADDSAIMVTLA